MKLWGLFQIFGVCCHLWIFLSSSPQETSGMSYVFIQGIIFWVLGYGCTGRQEDARWHSSTSSTSSKEGAKCDHPGAFSISARAAAHLSLPLLLLLPLLCRLGRYLYLCYLLTVLNSLWGGITALGGKFSIGALHSWVGQLCLFPVPAISTSVKENMFDLGRDVVKRWITNRKSWQYWWLDLRGTGCDSSATWLSLWRGGWWSAHLRPIQASLLIWLKTNCLIF